MSVKAAKSIIYKLESTTQILSSYNSELCRTVLTSASYRSDQGIYLIKPQSLVQKQILCSFCASLNQQVLKNTALVLQVLVHLSHRAEDLLIHKARTVQLAANRAPVAAPRLSPCAGRDGQAGPTSVPGCSEEELRERPKAVGTIVTCMPASCKLGAQSTLVLGCILNERKSIVQRKLIGG